MTAYTVIPDSNIDPEKPIRSIDGKNLRDNPIAITEGASGAPRIRTAALKAPEAGTAYLICNVQDATYSTTLDTYPAAGTYRGADLEQHLGVVALVAGTITMYGEHALDGSTPTGTSYFRVIKNGTILQEWTTQSFTFVPRQVNVPVSVGDVVIFQHRVQVAGQKSNWANLRVYSNNPDMAVA